jgi:hypothetical protein
MDLGPLFRSEASDRRFRVGEIDVEVAWRPHRSPWLDHIGRRRRHQEVDDARHKVDAHRRHVARAVPFEDLERQRARPAHQVTEGPENPPVVAAQLLPGVPDEFPQRRISRYRALPALAAERTAQRFAAIQALLASQLGIH